MESLVLLITCYILFLSGLSFAQEPDATECFASHELKFFCHEKKYEDAEKACEKNDSYLVKIDNAYMTEIIDTLIERGHCSYPEAVFIGGRATPHPNFPKNRSKRIWKWLDGSAIKFDEYSNWHLNQPNDNGENEDCLILDKKTKQWKDSPCSESKYYICQKNTTITVAVNLVLNGKQCVASNSSCDSHTEWRRGSKVVSENTSLTTYQTTSNRSSFLHHENATIGDAGKYTCTAWAGDDKTHQQFTSVEIFVNGTPEITNISSFSCNTSLHVVWKPSDRSVGFRHRIIATESMNATNVKVTEIIPNNTIKHSTEIEGLKPSTRYNVEVVACKEINSCSNDYATNVNATTLGTIVTVTNVTIQQPNAVGNDTCIVTWQWLHNISATFKIKLNRSLSEKGTTEDIGITSTNRYSFYSTPGQVYDVEVQPVLENETKFCPKLVKPGSCVGKKKQTTGSDLMLSIIPFAVVGGVIVLSIGIYCVRKRMKATPEQPDERTTNPIRSATDYGHLHSSANEVATDDTSTPRDLNSDQVVYATADDPLGLSEAPIYASVYNSKIKRALKGDSSYETKEATQQTTTNKQAADITKEMVINPIKDMEASSSNEKNDQPDTSDASGVPKIVFGSSAHSGEDLQFADEGPMYTAINKVKK